MNRLVIRTMKKNDISFAARCTSGEGWLTETGQDFREFLEHDARGCLIAEWKGRRCGICIATRYGDRGFIGEMIIRPAFRGKGLGSQVFRRAVDYLLKEGCRSISLDAVPRAASLYEAFGFKKICRSLRFSGSLSGAPSSRVRAMRSEDFAAVCSLDRNAFGADRSFFLRKRLGENPELANVRIDDDRITGYIFGRRRDTLIWAGPWWVERISGGGAELLQSFALGAQGAAISLGILEKNAGAVALVRALGFEDKPEASLRMVRGAVEDAPGLSPDLFAIGTPAKG
jgi:ribosomal protein S18 acetylase RimI-like enzyme